MSNIDKQGRQVQRYANFGVDMMEWDDGGYVKHSDYLALLDELEAANRLNIQLQQKCEIDPRTHQIIDLEERIAELEAREVVMPKLKMLSDYLEEVTMREREDILVGVRLEFHRALKEAGVKVAAAGKGV